MRNKFTFLLILLSLTAFCFSLDIIEEETYIIKPGNEFLIQISSIDTVFVKKIVSPEGDIDLFPYRNSIQLAGKTLKISKKIIEDIMLENLKNSLINVTLTQLSPISYFVQGAVVKSGFFYSLDDITLSSILYSSSGFLPMSSRRVELLRNGVTTTYNFREAKRKYEDKDDPRILNNDIITVHFAKNYMQLNFSQVAIDSLFAIEYFEINEPITLNEILLNMDVKVYNLNFDKISVLRNNKEFEIDLSEKILSDDIVFFHKKEYYIYVTGNANSPGRYLFEPNRPASYYLGLANGPNANGSTNTIYIIHQDGSKKKYKGQQILLGDELYIPIQDSFVKRLIKYLDPIYKFVSLWQFADSLTN